MFKPDGTEAAAPSSPVPPPQEVESLDAPQPNGKPTGWRIRDYYLDDKNASNWEQIRSAWTGNNGSQFVFNNRIQVNPQGTVDQPVTMPPIKFVNGATMPVLPTISAPTDMAPQGFPDDDADEEEDEEDIEGPYQPHQLKQHQQQPGTTPSDGLQYPWQWHNRKPEGIRHSNQRLHFHGKPTNAPTKPAVVTAQSPATAGTVDVVTKPTVIVTTDGQSNISEGHLGGKNRTAEGHQENSKQTQNGIHEAQNQGTKQQSQPKGQSQGEHEGKGQIEDEVKGQGTVEVKGAGQEGEENTKGNGQRAGEVNNQREDSQNIGKAVGAVEESDKERQKGEEGQKEGSIGQGQDGQDGGEGKLKDHSEFNDMKKNGSVVAETATYRNLTAVKKNETGINASTEAPKELPILNQPTTKSAQNFLPGIRPPSAASNGVNGERKDTYPPWSGGFVEQLRKNGWGTAPSNGYVNADTRKKEIAEGAASEQRRVADSELNQILREESRKIPSNEEAKNKMELKGFLLYSLIFIHFRC